MDASYVLFQTRVRVETRPALITNVLPMLRMLIDVSAHISFRLTFIIAERAP